MHACVITFGFSVIVCMLLNGELIHIEEKNGNLKCKNLSVEK